MRFFGAKKNRQLRTRPTMGSARAPMTYYRQRSQRPTTTFNNRTSGKAKARTYLSKLNLFMLVALILAGIIFSLIVNPKAKVELDNQIYRQSSEYTTAVNQQFSTVLNRFKPTLNQQAIIHSLQAKFPELSDVIIKLPLYARTPQVKLIVAPPSFILTGAAGTYGEQIKYVVAANGKAVGLAENFPQVTALPVINDQTSLPVKSGEVVLGKDTSQFILSVLAQCQKANVPVASFNLPKGSPEINLRTTDRNYYVKFNVDGDALIQTGQFLAARAQFDQSGEGPKEYLDVRVEGRIYYK
ncbi:TPA: hypothetical protein DIS56_00015 [Candidatus Saccharibacteria bacterium]|nr:MAG: hypothetical protein A3F05_00165 [Candidatus Saccharibacteria bacterium RIFCSPHIGHO2_12_FULL_47_17]HCM51513.1 hypothetical protein [Candidatus Saccharibacteria bacterium]